jgi:hypothetical protein
MLRTAVFVTLALLLQVASAEAAPPSASGLPAKVRQYVKDLNFACSRSGGIPSNSPGLLRTVDLTGDGHLDYVIDLGRYRCPKAEAFMYGGHNGSPIAIFVSGANGTAFLGYEGSSNGGVMVRTRRRRPQVWLTVGALLCGQPPASAKSFVDWWFCSRPLEWNARTNKFVFAPMREARRIHG